MNPAKIGDNKPEFQTLYVLALHEPNCWIVEKMLIIQHN